MFINNPGVAPNNTVIYIASGDTTHFGQNGFDLNAMKEKALQLRDTGAQIVANPSTALEAVGSTYCLTAHPELYYGVGAGSFAAGLVAYFVVSRIVRAFKPKVSA